MHRLPISTVYIIRLDHKGMLDRADFKFLQPFDRDGSEPIKRNQGLNDPIG